MLQFLLILMIIAVLTLFTDPLQRRLPARWSRFLLWTAFIVYLAGNLYFTLFSRVANTGTYVDLRPLGSYLRMLDPVEVDFQNVTGFAALFLKDISSFTSIALNILLYYPLGYLLKVLFPRLKGRQIVLIGLAASLCTESLQYLLKMGWFELDDLMHNTLGTAIGLLIRQKQLRRLLSRK